VGLADRSLPRTGAEELATGSDLSAGAKDGLVIDLVGSTEAVAASRAVIEAFGATRASVICDTSVVQ